MNPWQQIYSGEQSLVTCSVAARPRCVFLGAAPCWARAVCDVSVTIAKHATATTNNPVSSLFPNNCRLLAARLTLPFPTRGIRSIDHIGRKVAIACPAQAGPPWTVPGRFGWNLADDDSMTSGIGLEDRTSWSQSRSKHQERGMGTRRTPRIGTGWSNSPDPTSDPKITVTIEMTTPSNVHHDASRVLSAARAAAR